MRGTQDAGVTRCVPATATRQCCIQMAGNRLPGCKSVGTGGSLPQKQAVPPACRAGWSSAARYLSGAPSLRTSASAWIPGFLPCMRCDACRWQTICWLRPVGSNEARINTCPLLANTYPRFVCPLTRCHLLFTRRLSCIVAPRPPNALLAVLPAPPLDSVPTPENPFLVLNSCSSNPPNRPPVKYHTSQVWSIPRL
jgi:hypothetical protein